MDEPAVAQSGLFDGRAESLNDHQGDVILCLVSEDLRRIMLLLDFDDDFPAIIDEDADVDVAGERQQFRQEFLHQQFEREIALPQMIPAAEPFDPGIHLVKIVSFGRDVKQQAGITADEDLRQCLLRMSKNIFRICYRIC